MGDGEFPKKLKTACLQLQHVEDGEDVLRGKEALAKQVKDLEAACAGAEKPTFASTLSLRQFANYLDKEQFVLLKKLTDTLAKPSTSSSSSAASGSAVVSEAKPVVGKGKQKFSKDLSIDAVNALFVNTPKKFKTV